MQNTGTFEKKHFEKMLVIKVGKGRPTQILDKQIFFKKIKVGTWGGGSCTTKLGKPKKNIIK